MKSKIILFIFSFFLFGHVNAVYKVTLKDGFDHYYFYPSKYSNLYQNFTKYYWKGKEILLSDDEMNEFLKYDYLEKKNVTGINRSILRRFFEDKIINNLNQNGTGATLFISSDGKAKFSNKVFLDRKLDVDLAVFLLEKAIKENIDELELPVVEKEPVITFNDDVKKMGINGIISLSRSDYSNSSPFRLTNIRVAVSKFNGLILKPGETFSFTKHLGNVDPENGFVKELVIKSTSVEKEYGGGVCQVSTTVFRSALMAGFPIQERRNHSFAVNHYEPQGTDATIYIGNQDLKFKNILNYPVILQGIMQGDHLYFLVYGNKNDKKPAVKFFGPYFSNERPRPPDVFTPSSTLGKGEKMLLIKGQNGFDSTLFRVNNGKIERIFSSYKAVPNTWKIGM